MAPKQAGGDGDSEEEEEEEGGGAVNAAAGGVWKQLKLRADELPRKSSERWEANLAALQAFVGETGGRYPGRKSACTEEQKLGEWCKVQRMVRRGTNRSTAVLSAPQERRLQQVRDCFPPSQY